MKTILYFQSSLAASNMRELEGVRKYAADEGWKVQVIEYDGAAKSRYETAGGILPDVKGLVSLYRPDSLRVLIPAATSAALPRRTCAVEVREA